MRKIFTVGYSTDERHFFRSGRSLGSCLGSGSGNLNNIRPCTSQNPLFAPSENSNCYQSSLQHPIPSQEQKGGRCDCLPYASGKRSGRQPGAGHPLRDR